MTFFNTGHKGQRFGDSRSGGRRRHMGRDYGTAGKRGIPAGCPLNGFKVASVAWGRGYGHYVDLVSLDGKRRMRFAHLDSKPTHLKIGQEMNQGDWVGNVGRSGGNFPIHLHFEVHEYRNGQWVAVDPLKHVSDAQVEGAAQMAVATRAAHRTGRDVRGVLTGNTPPQLVGTETRDRTGTGQGAAQPKGRGVARPAAQPKGRRVTRTDVAARGGTGTVSSTFAAKRPRPIEMVLTGNRNPNLAKNRTASTIKPRREKSSLRNSMLGRWFGLDDESRRKRQASAARVREAGGVGGGGWFSNSFVGRMFGLDDESRIKRQASATQIRTAGGIGGGGWFSNSFVGRMLGIDDESRLARIRKLSSGTGTAIAYTETGVGVDRTLTARQPNAARYLSLYTQDRSRTAYPRYNGNQGR